MKNPVIIKYSQNKPYSVGDPYILRFNGKYYLYPSALGDEEGVRCFLSEDLIHFEDKGLVASSPLLRCAYAPEVIYHNGYFYMCTSPSGNGHYILKSTSPLGPFQIISENINNMIDGSFILDENFNLRFSRADHNGIAMLDFSLNGETSNRKNILPQVGYAWTEGPTIFYRNNYYYATYCGNFLESTSYRIIVASSHYIDKDYRVQRNPLLISTLKNYGALGHNSIVLGPNLDEYFIAYHQLNMLKEGGHFRYLGLDRLHFNGRFISTSPSYYQIQDPLKPDFESDLSQNKINIISENDFVLSNINCGDIFTAEYNFKGETTIILSYQNIQNYVSIYVVNNTITIFKSNNGNISTLYKKDLNINFEYFHQIRIINDLDCEILLDNVPLTRIPKQEKGKIGFKNKNEGLYYIAFSNDANGSSHKKIRNILPGYIESTQIINKNNFLFNQDETYSYLLKANDSIFFKTQSINKDEFIISINTKSNTKAKLKLETSLDSKTIIIDVSKNEYEFINIDLTSLFFNKEDELKITCLEGELNFKRLIINNKKIPFDYRFKNKFTLSRKGYYFSSICSNQELEFEYKKFNQYNLFGLIFNATNYSIHPSNLDPSYMGYLIGFRGNLLVVEHCQYDTIRIYDKPINLELHKKYKLSAKIKDSILRVYLDDKEVIKTTLPYDNVYGYGGVYKNQSAKVIISNYQIKETK